MLVHPDDKEINLWRHPYSGELLFSPKLVERIKAQNDACRSLPKELDVLLRQYKEDADTAIQEIASRAAISFIPYAGSAINEIKNGLAQRRVQERLNDLFEALKQRLDSVDEEKVDREYFHSEEFQTLLYLLLERLHTTHDKEKLKMFGNALGNAGVIDFKADDKEGLVRVLRDLSLADLTILNDGNLRGWTAHMPNIKIEYGGDVLPSLSRLQGMGLVNGMIKRNDLGIGRSGSARQDTVNAMSSLLTDQPRLIYHLSGFGERFLDFISTGVRPKEGN